MKKLSKILFVILAVALLFGLATTASAAEAASGTCGDNLTWVLTDDGTLTISGTGKMKNYDDDYATRRTPWYDYKSNIKSVFLSSGATSIGSDALSNCSNMTEITLPDGLTTIASDAFYNCKSLTNIALPKGLTSIGYSAFQNCHKLTNINFPEGLTTIGSYAFYNCGGLTTVTFPEGLTTIGGYAFSYCESLTTVTFPEGLTSTGNNTFSDCESLTEIVLPEGLTSIGYATFSYCSSLSKITIPVSVSTIDIAAFFYCSNLLDVYYSGTDADWEKVQIDYNNHALHYANLHTVCEGAEVTATYTDNKDGTHTVVKTCSDCGGSLGTATEPCKDGDRDGLCDGCKATVVTHEPESYSLLSLTLRDSNGKVATSIPTGTFYAEAKVKKLQEADPALIMLVTYDKNGKMLSTSYLYADVPVGIPYMLASHISNPGGKVGEVKAFILSSLGNPVPLGEAISVK